MKKLKLILAVCASIIMLSDTVCAKRFNKADVSNFWAGGVFGGFKNELDNIKGFLDSTTGAAFTSKKNQIEQNIRRFVGSVRDRDAKFQTDMKKLRDSHVTLTDADKVQLVHMILSTLLADRSYSETQDPHFKLRDTGPTDEELDIIIRSLFRAFILNNSETLNVLANFWNAYLNKPEKTILYLY